MKRLVLTLILMLWGFPSCPRAETNAGFVGTYSGVVYRYAKWGAETNGIQLGVDIPWMRTPLSSHKFDVTTYLFNTASSNRYGLFLTPHGSRLNLMLRAADGTPVGKTRKGNALCKPVPSHFLLHPSARVLGARAVSKYEEPFNLLECFKVRESGVYTLSVKATVYTMSSNGDLNPMNAPEAQIQISVVRDDLE